jgi:SAM-dependent methyltransferase
VASRHLVPGGAGYLGDLLLYRSYLQPPWQELAARVSNRPLVPDLCRDDPYPTRNLHYVRALDQLARQKACEITTLLAATPWHGPILDVGGGAGALGRAFSRSRPGATVTLFELPEVLAAAHAIYPDPGAWAGMTTRAGDFRDHPFAPEERFGLILLANVLHTYDPAEAQASLAKAVGLLAPGGVLLIHDYCPDRTPVKGQLYDLLMMLNTPCGVCHEAQILAGWLAACGLSGIQIIDLPSDSSLILGSRPSC